MDIMDTLMSSETEARALELKKQHQEQNEIDDQEINAIGVHAYSRKRAVSILGVFASEEDIDSQGNVERLEIRKRWRVRFDRQTKEVEELVIKEKERVAIERSKYLDTLKSGGLDDEVQEFIEDFYSLHEQEATMPFNREMEASVNLVKEAIKRALDKRKEMNIPTVNITSRPADKFVMYDRKKAVEIAQNVIDKALEKYDNEVDEAGFTESEAVALQKLRSKGELTNRRQELYEAEEANKLEGKHYYDRKPQQQEETDSFEQAYQENCNKLKELHKGEFDVLELEYKLDCAKQRNEWIRKQLNK